LNHVPRSRLSRIPPASKGGAGRRSAALGYAPLGSAGLGGATLGYAAGARASGGAVSSDAAQKSLDKEIEQISKVGPEPASGRRRINRK
jgi:hypothetical protein